MNAFSWPVLLFVLIFYVLARYVLRPDQRHTLMTVGAVIFIFLQDAPVALMRFLYLAITAMVLIFGWKAGQWTEKRRGEMTKGFWAGCIGFILAPLVLFKFVQAVVPTHLIEVAMATRGNMNIGALAPLGISYFTFRALAYLIEIRKGSIEPVGFWRYLNYVAFWPTYMAGPIERPGAFLSQTAEDGKITDEDVRIGVFRILEGLFKKLVVGGIFYQICKPFILLQGVKLSHLESWSCWQLWACLTAYYLYLYCDFAGYSDVAIGAARIFGYRIMENFNWPILATNVADFWRRWHISLTGWITDYVYIGLGGNRQGLSKAAKNTVIAMLLVGIWHGLNIHFALWGVYHAIWLNIYRRYRKERKQDRPKTWWRTGLAWFITFQIINLGWVLFLFRPRVAIAVFMKLFMLS